MKNPKSLFLPVIMLFVLFQTGCNTKTRQDLQYVPRFEDVSHPEIGYWFISPDLLVNERYMQELDTIIHQCPYTLVFLTARAGADFYDEQTMHPVFKKIVEKAHKNGLKVGLQLWGNYNDKTIEESQRMIVGNEVELDLSGRATVTVKAEFIRFPDRLLKTDLFKVYAFRKTSEGFYDPATLTDITGRCKTVLPSKDRVVVKIEGGKDMKGLTAFIMVQEYCSQSSMWGNVEIDGFVNAMKNYADVHFDGFALDEYGNKFVERIPVDEAGHPFRGRWYSTAMSDSFRQATGKSLEKTLFDSRYAPEGKSEMRALAINQYMDFMRRGALRVETAVYNKSREIFGTDIFNGIHSTYHNHLTNDEIWANGIDWWTEPRKYGQTDEKTSTPVQMGIAMAHPMNAMYNQYYDKVFPPVEEKALKDLRYGIRTHYHAMHDLRPNRFDLLRPEAIKGINDVERCSRLLNRFNPSLPRIHLLVVFGMEALENWYPDEANRGVYDINGNLDIESKVIEIWNAGYLNALVPSDLINNHTLTIGEEGKPVLNGHTFDAVLYLYPQYAKESELQFLENYEKQGGKLMIEGSADHDFDANDISGRYKAIYEKATVQGYSVQALPKLGLQKDLLPDGCENEDGSFVFTDLPSLKTDTSAVFKINVDGVTWSGRYKGLAVIKADKASGLQKFAASGFMDLKKNGKVMLRFPEPVDIFLTVRADSISMMLADSTRSLKPLTNKLTK